MKLKVALLFVMLATTACSFAQSSLPNGVFLGYDGEWQHVTEQLLQLAQAIPADKYTFRPVAGVRSTSEVFMHIAGANYWMIEHAGVKLPDDVKLSEFKKVTTKEDVIKWLKRSFDDSKKAHDAVSPQDMKRMVDVEGRQVPIEGIYLRLIIHDNEHMGQLIAYARMSGVTPPWSQ